MDTQEQSSFFKIPVELAIQILDALPFRALLTCRRVCRFFQALVDHTPKLQYNIELAVSGMVDGPFSTLGVVQRLDRLRRHQHAWDTMAITRDFFIEMIRGYVWELYGGILAQCRIGNTCVFWQLPSVYRGISASNWTVHIDEREIQIRDFTIDPTQNLLVIVECSRNQITLPGDYTFRTHFRSLLSGAVHPLASQSSCISFEIHSQPTSFYIQASGEYVGVHFLYEQDMGINQLYVWEWKTCQIKMKLVGSEIKSFTFLDESHVLLAILTPTPAAKLLILNFKEPSAEESPMARCICALDFPDLDPRTFPAHIMIRSDPMPTWEPSSEHQLPFHHRNRDQIFVITLWLDHGGPIRNVVLFVPTSTLLAQLPPSNNEQHIAWHMWGPDGTRMISDIPVSSVWVCYVYGTKFVVSRRIITGGCSVEVYDFNQLGFKRAHPDRISYRRTKFIANAETIRRDVEFPIFAEDVQTSLPYRKQTFFLENKGSGGRIEAVMCTEDSLVVVCNRQFQVLAF